MNKLIIGLKEIKKQLSKGNKNYFFHYVTPFPPLFFKEILNNKKINQNKQYFSKKELSSFFSLKFPASAVLEIK